MKIRGITHRITLVDPGGGNFTGLKVARQDSRGEKQVALEENEPLACVACSPEAIRDAAMKPVYASPCEAGSWTSRVNEDGVEWRGRSTDGRLGVSILYTLDEDEATLRKVVRCEALIEPVYLAGVRLWRLSPGRDMTLAWPPPPSGKDTDGQPAVFIEDGCAWIVTLEWPESYLHLENGSLALEYRPGYELKPGQPREVCAGSILLVELEDNRVAPLEQARRAFFDHVRQRVKPRFPYPVKFTTWGPWMCHVHERRILDTLATLQELGVNLVHVDAGWQYPDRPYSARMPAVRNADDAAWDRAMTNPERFPGGLLPVLEAARRHGMRLSLWFDASGTAFIRECEEWASRTLDGTIQRQIHPWEARWSTTPQMDMQSPYGDALREFFRQMRHRYGLGGVMFDNHFYGPADALGRWPSMANNWNQPHVALRCMLEMLDEAEAESPGIYRFFCGDAAPWTLLHCAHVHAGDPSQSPFMRRLLQNEYPPRALAVERRDAWRRLYQQRFVPPWGIKGDIAGWSVQQQSPIPLNPDHVHLVPGVGEGWTQNLFTCFAMTSVRDLRFEFRQMPDFDRGVLKKWLAWGQQRATFAADARPWWRSSDDPTTAVEAIAQIRDGRGLIFIFNPVDEPQPFDVLLDERAGFRPEDPVVSAHLVYPLVASLPTLTLRYGQRLTLTIPSRDCVVIECGLEPPAAPAPYADYQSMVAKVRRGFQPIHYSRWSELLEALLAGPVLVEMPDHPRERAVCEPLTETLAAWRGERSCLDTWRRVPVADASCRVIVGSFDGLASHPLIGKHFTEQYDSRFVEWEGHFHAAPLVFRWSSTKTGPPTFVLTGPRPEHLVQLSKRLTQHVLQQCDEVAVVPGTHHVSWSHSYAMELPEAPLLLRFLPAMVCAGAPAPVDLSLVQYRIVASVDGTDQIIWQQTVPPCAGPVWWGDRIVPIDDLAGRRVRFRFEASHANGDPCAVFTAGIRTIAVCRRPIRDASD